jgi:hypothetical protein
MLSQLLSNIVPPPNIADSENLQPTREPLDSFLKPFHLELREKLAFWPILFSQSEELGSPNNFNSVPEKFTFNGTPITTCAQTSARYLSGFRVIFEVVDLLGLFGFKPNMDF